MDNLILPEISSWKKTKKGSEHSFSIRALRIIKKFLSNNPKYVIKNITDSTIIINNVKE